MKILKCLLFAPLILLLGFTAACGCGSSTDSGGSVDDINDDMSNGTDDDVNDNAEDDLDDDNPDDDIDDDANDDADDDVNDDMDDDNDDDINDDANDDVDDDVNDDVNDDVDDDCDPLDDDTVWDLDPVECCLPNDPCLLANDGLCECPLMPWDAVECEACCNGFGLTPHYDPPPGFFKGEMYFQEIDRYSLGATGIDVAVRDGKKYIVAASGLYVYLYDYDESHAWHRTVIDSGADHPAMVMDSSGFLHIVYTLSGKYTDECGLMYATNQSGQWEKVLLKDGLAPWINLSVNNRTSIDIDDSDFLHITFMDTDGQNERFFYLTNISGTWSSDELSSCPDGRHQISATGDGHVFIALDIGLALTNIGGSAFYTYTLCPFIGFTKICTPYALDVDAMGDIHVINRVNDIVWDFEPYPTYPWYDVTDSAAHYEKRPANGYGWIDETLPTVKPGDDLGAGIAAEDNGTAHCVFNTPYTFNYEENGKAYYMTNGSGQWDKDTFPCLRYYALYNAIDLDEMNRPQWAFGGGSLCFADNENGPWAIWNIDPAKDISWLVSDRFKIDGQGNPHFLAQIDAGVGHFARLGGNWQMTEAVPNATHNKVAGDIDANGHVHVIFSRMDDNLYYATNRSGEWTEETLDSLIYPFAYRMHRFVADDQGYVHFSSTDEDHNQRYVTNKSGAWELHSFNPETMGYGIPMTIDANGAGHFLYKKHDEPRYLVYANDVGGQWSYETIEETGDPIGIELDSLGYAHAAYEDSEGDAVYLNNTGGQWQTMPIPHYACYGSQFRVDQNGGVYYFCYHEIYRLTGNDWEVYELPRSPEYMAIDDAGYIHAGFKARSSDLNYIKFPADWQGE